MASTWGLLGRILAKKVEKKDDRRPISERIDLSLPLGIRMNGIVEVPMTEFILGGTDLKIKHPGNSNVVLSMGKFSIGESTVHRFYLDAVKDVYMLQFVMDKKGLIEECKLFMPFDEVHPDQTGWDFWLNDNQGYIGYSVFEAKDGASYARVWENEGCQVDFENGFNRIPPVDFKEIVYFDAYGDSREEVSHNAMLYGRHLNENVDEYILVTAAEGKDTSSVQIMVGIPLESTSLKVI